MITSRATRLLICSALFGMVVTAVAQVTVDGEQEMAAQTATGGDGESARDAVIGVDGHHASKSSARATDLPVADLVRRAGEAPTPAERLRALHLMYRSDADNDVRAGWVSFYRARLRQEPDEDVAATVGRYLGKLGHWHAPARRLALEVAATDQRPQVRLAVMKSLLFTAEDDVVDQWRQTVLGDSNETVRRDLLAYTLFCMDRAGVFARDPRYVNDVYGTATALAADHSNTRGMRGSAFRLAVKVADVNYIEDLLAIACRASEAEWTEWVRRKFNLPEGG